ncbi:MAG: CHAT domain-containing protein [Acidobacteria bacterium]|nr:CHAT domain-containing protein [Acidobacteriota bacterium]
MWAAQLLPDVGKLDESRRRLASLIAKAEAKRFNVLLPPAYFWLGVSDNRRNDLSQASRNYKTALRLAEAGENAFEVQHAREALARYYTTLGELEPAMSYAGAMLNAKDLYYQSRTQSWRDKGLLASLAVRLKLFATSLSFARERLSFAREISPAGGFVNSSLRFVVKAAVEKGDLDAASKYADESLRLALERGDSPENTQTKAESYLLLADVRGKMEDCDAALTEYDKALELYHSLPQLTANLYQIHKGRLLCLQRLERREEFAAELRMVRGLAEKYRATLREDSSRQAFFADQQDAFDAAATDAVKEGDSAGAFALVEESRARSLLDFVGTDRPLAQVEENFRAAARPLLREEDFPAVTRPLSLEEIRARLPEQVQFVRYAVLPDRLELWVVSKTRFDLIERPITAAELEKRVDAYQSSVVGKESGEGVRRAARELYELLIPPGLDTGKQLCLIPDKSLHQLAFASLVSPAGKYLLEEFALFYAPSASVLVLATEHARLKGRAENERLLSVGNPDFDREVHSGLPDLRAAEVEAKAVAAGYRQRLELLGGEATKEAFLRSFANVEVIHFAGHFLANPQSPGDSKLLFAAGELRSSELGKYKLPRASLVVLSACETGFERYDRSEGAIGVARTFLALGAPVVVASQWKVDSEPTKDLMIAFHRNRKERGLSSAESLRRAQLELLNRDETRAPFYWAAFSLFGGYANY